MIQSAAPLAGDADGQTDVFAWTRDDGQLRLISTPEAGAPASGSTDAFLVAYSDFVFGAQAETFDGGRSVGGAGDGRVFFTTADSLTADDTDGDRFDVYAWSTDGSLELVSPPGDAQTDATYLESSPDGSRVFFTTDETLLPGDTDGGVDDIYLAILGGGSAPSKPVPTAAPAGPAAAAGALPQVPDTPVPASGTPKPVEPVDVDPPLDPVDEGDDDGDRAERAKLKARVGKRLGADGAKLVAKASAAGELRIRAVARLRRDGELRKVRVADVEEEIAAGERTRFDVALSDAAMERFEERGRLRVRFVLRLKPSGEQRAAKERVTVTLQSGQRR